MNKKMYLIISIVFLLIALTGTILFLKNKSVSYISVKTKYYNNNTANTNWSYRYSDKYNNKTHKWDLDNTNLYVFKNGKWVIPKINETPGNDNVSTVKVEKKSKGVYFIMVEGNEKAQKGVGGISTFNDAFTVNCATSKITEGN